MHIWYCICGHYWQIENSLRTAFIRWISISETKIRNSEFRPGCSVDRYERNQLHYPLDRDLSGGWRYPAFEQLEPALYMKPEISLTIGIWNPRFMDKEY